MVKLAQSHLRGKPGCRGRLQMILNFLRGIASFSVSSVLSVNSVSKLFGHRTKATHRLVLRVPPLHNEGG